ncbi:phosphatase PAP2 family protein [Micromonospora sp. 067-2]|uniref:phosphatase PAP2 family protein n=1 Tax=Micromonospora sp. 067-2 TaxID=2789270 RepID=UPI003977F85A
MNYHFFELVNGGAGRRPYLDATMVFCARWLLYVVFAAGALMVAFALRRGRVRPVIEFAVTLLLSFAAAFAVSHVSHELRPFQSHHVHQLIAHDPGVALPSDHATAAFAIAFGTYAFFNHRWGIILGFVATTIGLARIWVGVHYPGDILAAAAIAALSAIVVVLSGRLAISRQPT